MDLNGLKKAIFKWDGLIRVLSVSCKSNLNPTVFRYFTKGSEVMFKSSNFLKSFVLQGEAMLPIRLSNLVFFTELAQGWRKSPT